MIQMKRISAFYPKDLLGSNHPALICFSSMPLYRLERSEEKYGHLLKEKDIKNMGPLVKYFLTNSGNVVFLAGDIVKNLYLRGKRRRYKSINMVALLKSDEVDKYSTLMDNIISSNDGAFSMGCKYRVRKNRKDGDFKDIAHARYTIEPRLEGLEKLLFLFRPSAIELDLMTRQRFSSVFGVEVR